MNIDLAEARRLADWIAGAACGGSNWNDNALRTSIVMNALAAEVESLSGLRPEVPERPPHNNDASHQHPALPRYGLRWNGPGEPVSVPMPDGYWTPFHLALEGIEQAPVRVPSDDDIEWPDVDDMAHSAAQEAYSFGINHDLFKRHMTSVMFKTAGAFRRALDPMNT